MLQVIVKASKWDGLKTIHELVIVNRGPVEGSDVDDLRRYSVALTTDGKITTADLQHKRSDGALTLVRKAIEGLGG